MLAWLSPTGRQHTVDRLLAPDWVNVVAVTDRNEMLFVRKWRFGTRTFTPEVPAGLMDAGEEPLAAGQRELLEETGYAGPNACVIGTVLPNPAFTNNRAITICIPQVTRLAEQQLDPIDVVADRALTALVEWLYVNGAAAVKSIEKSPPSASAFWQIAT